MYIETNLLITYFDSTFFIFYYVYATPLQGYVENCHKRFRSCAIFFFTVKTTGTFDLHLTNLIESDNEVEDACTPMYLYNVYSHGCQKKT